ncbi:MAG: ATP-binding cassette domain-containing protein [Coriobacteriaceae bacterium]|jgi:putative ABC transport system ATP-binding protein|nr:ATP-binding cassette domain-containing protein [Coriobacteriaceae bacterium]
MELFEAKDISASFGQGIDRQSVFTNANLVLKESCIYDLVGQSGSGKSTLLRVLARMLGRDSGRLFLDGRSSEDVPTTFWRRSVCLVPQKTALVAGSVKENLLLPWSLKIHEGEMKPADEELENMLATAGLADIGLHRDVAQLSGGQAARVSLLRVFATKPKVLLLDEVDAALDDETSWAISSLTSSLVEGKMACLRIRHRASDGFAQGIYNLSQGTVSYADSTVSARKASPSSKEAAIQEACSSLGCQTGATEERGTS